MTTHQFTLVFPILVAVGEFLASLVFALAGEWKAAGVWFFYSLAAGLLAFMR